MVISMGEGAVASNRGGERNHVFRMDEVTRSSAGLPKICGRRIHVERSNIRYGFGGGRGRGLIQGMHEREEDQVHQVFIGHTLNFVELNFVKLGSYPACFVSSLQHT